MVFFEFFFGGLFENLLGLFGDFCGFVWFFSIYCIGIFINGWFFSYFDLEDGSFWSDLGFEYSLEDDDEVFVRVLGELIVLYFFDCFKDSLWRNERVFKYGIDLGIYWCNIINDFESEIFKIDLVVLILWEKLLYGNLDENVYFGVLCIKFE